MASTRISYSPRPDATPEVETNALAAVYSLLLDRHAQKKDGPTTVPDAKENKDARADASIP